jgi:hypothetical protein
MNNKEAVEAHHSTIVAFLKDEDVQRRLFAFILEGSRPDDLLCEVLRSNCQLQPSDFTRVLGVKRPQITKIKSNLNEHLKDFSREYGINPNIQLYFQRKEKQDIRIDGGYLACSYNQSDNVCDRLISLERLVGRLSKVFAQIKGIAVHAALRILEQDCFGQSKEIYIKERESPRHVKALVLFLSPPKKDYNAWNKQADLDEYDLNEILEKHFKEDPWRMPLEAIAYHLDRLEKVILVPSKETEKYVSTFQELTKTLTQSYSSRKQRKEIEVLSINEFNASFSKYIDSESVEDQNDIINKVLNQLTGETKIKCEDIIIDITGGKKISSIAGAIVALGMGWRFEYVSTTDYRLREYDITIEVGEI